MAQQFKSPVAQANAMIGKKPSSHYLIAIDDNHIYSDTPEIDGNGEKIHFINDAKKGKKFASLDEARKMLEDAKYAFRRDSERYLYPNEIDDAVSGIHFIEVDPDGNFKDWDE